MMRLRSRFMAYALAAAVGCGGSSPPPAGPAGNGGQTAQAASRGDMGVGEEEDDSTAELAQHHRHHHHGGFAMFIAMSLDSLGVSAEQHDAIVKIQTTMRAQMEPARVAEKGVLLALADGVAAGHVDSAKLAPAIAQLSAASAKVHDAVADSLAQLHQVLTPPQRLALVDKVEANLSVWHHANSPDHPAAKDTEHGHVAKLAHDLDLTAEQADKIRATYHDSLAGAPKYDKAAAEAHMQALATAFKAETFDAKALESGGTVNANMATWGVQRLVLLYTAAAPVLTEAQRNKAAEELRSHANYKRSTDR